MDMDMIEFVESEELKMIDEIFKKEKEEEEKKEEVVILGKQENIFKLLISASDATKKYNLGRTTIISWAKAGKLVEGKDFKRMGNAFICLESSIKREYDNSRVKYFK